MFFGFFYTIREWATVSFFTPQVSDIFFFKKMSMPHQSPLITNCVLLEGVSHVIVGIILNMGLCICQIILTDAEKA